MTIPTTSMGRLSTGEAVHLVTLSAGPLRVQVITYGAAIRDVRHEGVPHPLVLGLNSAADYEAHSPHFGAIAGRVANRIAGGRFNVDGRDYEVTRNEKGRNTLHGGTLGFGKRNWLLKDHDTSNVTLTLLSPDRDEGFPGALIASCTYRLRPEGVIEVALTARTDSATLVNLAHHSYFNLDGAANIDGHRIQIAAESYLPVDRYLIPTSAITPVADTAFDFRNPRRLGEHRYDHNFCLASARRPTPEFAARVEAGQAWMEVWTTEPGLQLYDGAAIACPVSGLDNRHYGPRGGLCLEPQMWPDAPNHPTFPSVVLRPNETYEQVSEFHFGKLG